MTTTRKGAARPRPYRPTSVGAATATKAAGQLPTTARSAPVDAARSAPAPEKAPDGLEARLERAAQPILAVTYWFDPVALPEPSPVTIRFTGRRVGVGARQLQPGDQFLHDETIQQVLPGSGPIALTARVRGITPGEWEVTAGMLELEARPKRGRQPVERVRTLDEPVSGGILARLWRLWAPQVGAGVSLRTRREPFIHIPGVIPLIWVTLVTVGFAIAVIEQALMLTHLRLPIGPAVLSTLVAIAAGIVGAKVWYVVKHWRTHAVIGWCIQGFITGATAGAILAFSVSRVPVATVLDATAPGLMFAMAVGRVGCFLAGCCGGPPTTASWGVWCSDQHVGARRVPTQLLESLFCLLVGVGTFAAVWTRGPAGGWYFIAAVAAYTLFREWILRLRSEPLITRLPVAVTPIVSALVLVVASVAIAIVR